MDHEVREHGIRSLIVQPAYTRTGFEANSAKPDTPLHAYAKQRQTVDRVMAEAISNGDAPAVVAKAIVAAATDARPKLRYTAGPTAGRVRTLRRLVPARAFDKQIRTINHLAGWPAGSHGDGRARPGRWSAARRLHSRSFDAGERPRRLFSAPSTTSRVLCRHY